MSRSVRFDFTPPDDWDPDGTAKQAWDEIHRQQQELVMRYRQQEEDRLQDIVRQVTRTEIMQVLRDMETGSGYPIDPVLYAQGRLLERMAQTQERMQG